LRRPLIKGAAATTTTHLHIHMPFEYAATQVALDTRETTTHTGSSLDLVKAKSRASNRADLHTQRTQGG